MPRIGAERPDIIAALAEVFREHGYDGATLALISKATCLGKGSLYHFFPGGKDEMMVAVLTDIDQWFEDNVFAQLRSREDPAEAISVMFEAVIDYFRSGRRVCLVGALALGQARDRFAAAINDYFARWIEALEHGLRGQRDVGEDASLRAEEIVLGIQGAIVLSRAIDDPTVFERAMSRLQLRVAPSAALASP
jgi:TetR/AcrR family transcriptional regulator, lmrAB and yxaGH operons repressor